MFKSKIEEQAGFFLQHTRKANNWLRNTIEAASYKSHPFETRPPLCRFISVEHENKVMQAFSVKPFRA